LSNATAVYDIVTGPNSLGHLVDLYVIIHLQHLVLIDEGSAGRLYGEKGAAHLATALSEVRGEIDRLAELAMKADRKARLDQLIQDWRKHNPDVELVSGIRFGSLPTLSGKSLLEIIPSFFDVLNPMDDASHSVDESRLLAERAFYFAKRLPRLLDWQTDSALDDLLVKPEAHQVLKEVAQAGASIDRVSRIIERVPDLVAAERRELLAAWDARQKEAGSTLREIRATFSEGKDLAAEVNTAGKSLELTFDALDRIVNPANDGTSLERSKPFDIGDYSVAATEIAKMARDANSLVNDGNSLLTSPAWSKRQEEVSRLASDAVGHAERGSRRVVDHLAWRMVQVLVVFFGLLLLYRIARRLLEGRRTVDSGARKDLKTNDPTPEGFQPSRQEA